MSAASMKAWRKKNPMRAAYINLKSNAKRRHVHFDLTLDEFKTHLWDEGYMLKRGLSSDSLTIDRIKVSGGYTVGNVQLLTNAENIRKKNLVDYPKKKPDNDCPF